MSRTRRLAVALAIDLAIALAELIGGIAGHSTGLLATAGHDLADGGALGLALVATVLVGRPATPTRSYGWHRMTILTALANAAGIVVVAVLVAIFAIHRLLSPVHVRGGVMIAFAILAFVGNASAAWIVHERRELNMRAAALHLFADAVSSLGVLAAGIVILTTSSFVWLDPAVALAIDAFVVFEGVVLVRRSVDVLLESTPSDLSSVEVSAVMSAMPGVADVHDLHCWSLSTEVRALSAHVVLTGHPTLEEAQVVAEAMKCRLRDGFGIVHATLELECEPCAAPAVDPCAIEPASPVSMAERVRG